ncbi:hypothetical protein NHX12_005611 [Muraenolepis orangiensis]|uniref:non-specific serine/threonine protein kinase n=1 Tax=Muraenolepis orangiensis TaxID=630683 RepID=A0A9Q0IDW8_9TELE|nr:hypothetical protein NHX12_005611 [Muraenolepis orangiensis]
MASSSTFGPPQLEDYILTERLGSGTYATVYKAYSKGDSRDAVAVKVVAKKSLNKTSMENLLTEIEILKTVRHPHIVQLKDFQWDSENIYLILEWCSGGDLSRFIRSRRLLPERVARRFLQQIDFGFAQHMSPWDEQSALRGSPLYMAPEMVCRRQYDARADLWSVGVILYEAVFGRAPFASRSYAELEEKIRSDRPVERNPETRITFDQFFSHSFVDLEHMGGPESLGKAKELVLQAVKKDQEGERAAALSLYCSALEHFVPAVHYEADRVRKEALRQKVSQYASRAEELKALVASDNRVHFEEAKTARDVLREMSRDRPRLLAALELARVAIAKEDSGFDDQGVLDLYQQCLGELLLALAAEAQGRRRELLHCEIKSLMSRAEYLKENIKMQETQKDVSLDREPLSESVRSFCCLQ